MSAQRISGDEAKKTPGRRLALTLESTLESVNLAESFVLQFSEAGGFSEQQREEIGLAVRESLANAVVHGNCGDPGKKVVLEAYLSDTGVVIAIQDEGKGFDPDSLPDPRNPENLLRQSGRGVFLMKNCMDEVIMHRLASSGMEVRMIKHLSNTALQEHSKVSIKASSRQVDSVTIVDLSGRITLGEATSILREALQALAGKGQKKILLNLADVNYIDSSGLGGLISGYTSLTNQGGQLKLLNLTKKVHDLLQITKLLTVFEVFSDEATAIKSFN